MILKLKRFNEGVWIDCPLGGKFKIRPMAPSVFTRCREDSKLGKIAVTLPTGKYEIVDNYDEAKFQNSVFSHALEDWQDCNVEGASSKNEERETIFNYTRLRDWITEQAVKLFDDQQLKLEEESKNLETSQGG